jgi:hypothetical protein
MNAEREHCEAEAPHVRAIQVLKEVVNQQQQRHQDARAQAEEEARRQRKEDRKNPKACRHKMWWDRVEGESACPKCGQVEAFITVCRGCAKHACLKCQDSPYN